MKSLVTKIKFDPEISSRQRRLVELTLLEMRLRYRRPENQDPGFVFVTDREGLKPFVLSEGQIGAIKKLEGIISVAEVEVNGSEFKL